MKINILTLFPEMFDGFINNSIINKAVEKDLIQFNIINFRDYSTNKHKKVDDYPYTKSGGMLLMVQPIDDAIISNNLQNTYTIYPTPTGEVFSDDMAKELSKHKELTFIAGRYEGIDQRIIDMHVDKEISIGDYVLTGGELPIQVIVDATCRYIKDVLKNDNSALNDSFSNGLLEHPQYTRPQVYKNYSVPSVLVNGNHKLVEEYILYEQLKKTYFNRKDLYNKVILNEKEKEILKNILNRRNV